MSFLSKVGSDFKAVFAFLGSPKAQPVEAAVEGVAETIATVAGVGAPVQAGINLINNWLTEIVKAEALAAAAGQQTGSGVQKAAAVMAEMTPQVLTFATAQGLPAPTAAMIATINTSLVAALNTLGADAPAPAA